MNFVPLKPSMRPTFPWRKNISTYMVITVLIALAALVYILPGFLQHPLNSTGKTQIYYMGVLIKDSALYKYDALYLPFDFIKERIDSRIAWDEKNSIVIITTAKNVFHFPLGIKEGLLNLEEYSFTYPVVREGEALYVPADPLLDVYDLEAFEDTQAMLVRIHDLKEPLQEGQVIKDSKLRKTPSFRSSYAAKAARDEQVSVMREDNGWFWVETAAGTMGYIEKGRVRLASIKTAEIIKDIYPPWNPLSKPVILTWEYAGLTTTRPADIGNLDGVQVLSPTWFHLTQEGLVLNRADKRYVDWAHQKGRQVWALFDNGFNPELTHEFFSDVGLRIKVIKQLLSYVDMYKLDGINIDFENMYLKDKSNFVQFIRELAPLLHEKERTLSVDVTFLSNSETWSMCYDRKALSAAADYLIVMGYDEHGQSSRVAGSVSSLPWVEAGLIKILAEVLPAKLILGIPFYTRLWQEETDAAGKTKLTSKAFSMENAIQWINENGAETVIDEMTGQQYVELSKENIKYKMWLEDEYSLTKRIELMKKYRLAGFGAWRRGFERDTVWPVLSSLAKQVW